MSENRIHEIITPPPSLPHTLKSSMKTSSEAPISANTLHFETIVYQGWANRHNMEDSDIRNYSTHKFLGLFTCLDLSPAIISKVTLFIFIFLKSFYMELNQEPPLLLRFTPRMEDILNVNLKNSTLMFFPLFDSKK